MCLANRRPNRSPDQGPNPPEAGPRAEPETKPHGDAPEGLPPGFDPSREVLLNARSLRGLAHPVRVRMLSLLREAGPATATGLAPQLGLNTGAASYHLRQLAAHGFVVEDVERGTARERWWRAAHRTTWYDPAAAGDDDRALGDAYLRAVGQRYADRLLEALDELPTLPPRWRTAGTMSDTSLRVTPEQLVQLVEEISAVLRRYRQECHRTDTDDAAPPRALRRSSCSSRRSRARERCPTAEERPA